MLRETVDGEFRGCSVWTGLWTGCLGGVSQGVYGGQCPLFGGCPVANHHCSDLTRKRRGKINRQQQKKRKRFLHTLAMECPHLSTPLLHWNRAPLLQTSSSSRKAKICHFPQPPLSSPSRRRPLATPPPHTPQSPRSFPPNGKHCLPT